MHEHNRHLGRAVAVGLFLNKINVVDKLEMLQEAGRALNQPRPIAASLPWILYTHLRPIFRLFVPADIQFHRQKITKMSSACPPPHQLVCVFVVERVPNDLSLAAQVSLSELYKKLHLRRVAEHDDAVGELEGRLLLFE